MLLGACEGMKENCICLTKTKPVSRLGFTQETKVTSVLPVTLSWHATSPKPHETSLTQLLNLLSRGQCSGHQPVHKDRRKPAVLTGMRQHVAQIHSSSLSGIQLHTKKG